MAASMEELIHLSIRPAGFCRRLKMWFNATIERLRAGQTGLHHGCGLA